MKNFKRFLRIVKKSFGYSIRVYPFKTKHVFQFYLAYFSQQITKIKLKFNCSLIHSFNLFIYLILLILYATGLVN